MRCLFHFFLWYGNEKYTADKLGPHDPRTEEERTFNREMKVCVKCGLKREYKHAYDGCTF